MVMMIAGCSVTASLGGDAEQGSTGTEMIGTSSTTSSSSGAAAGTGTSGASAEMGTTRELDSGSTEGGTTTASSSSSGGSEGGSTGAQPLVCQGPGDASCLSCLRDSCCEALELCLTTPLCSCVLGCLEFAPDFVSCLDIPACNVGPVADALQVCAAGGCGPACGL